MLYLTCKDTKKITNMPAIAPLKCHRHDNFAKRPQNPKKKQRHPASPPPRCSKNAKRVCQNRHTLFICILFVKIVEKVVKSLAYVRFFL